MRLGVYVRDLVDALRVVGTGASVWIILWYGGAAWLPEGIASTVAQAGSGAGLILGAWPWLKRHPRLGDHWTFQRHLLLAAAAASLIAGAMEAMHG